MEREGIDIQKGDVKKNKGLRQIAKICLNSFWGKLAQNTNLPQTELFADPEKYFKLLQRDDIEISSIAPLANLMTVTYKEKEEYSTPLKIGNVILASFVTAYSRLHLYELLDNLQEKVLYFDTDSCIFVLGPNESLEDFHIDLGDSLGQWGCEISSNFPDGSYIKDFVSAGPKVYSYSVVDKDGNVLKIESKCKGFTLTHDNSQKINFDSMYAQVRRYLEDGDTTESAVAVKTPVIRRLKGHKIVTRSEEKVQKLVYKKRTILPDSSTLPFGY